MKIKRFLKADRSFQEQVREHDNSPYAKLSRIEKAGHAYESEDDDDFEEVIIEEYDEDEENRKRWKKRIINLVFDSLIVAGVVMLVYGGYSLYTYHKDNQESKESYEKLEDEGFVKVELPTLVPTPNGSENPGENSTESARPKEWYEQIWVDLEGLQTKVNSDIIGWIFFENEEISYPILHSDDNSKYERVRYDNVFATSGSIFLEANNKGDFSEKRNIIYGHNMKDMTMFGRLHYYRDRSYYDTHKYFQVIHDGMVYRYQVFSYFEIMETEVDYIDVNFASEEEYAAIFKKMTTNGMHQLDVPVTMEDKTITLLTCTGAEDRRYIVNAVLVDQHALANADGTYPGEENNTENNTENGTDTPSTETQQPDTPDNKPEDKPKYTYTEMYKIMWAKVSVKIRNQPTVDSVRIGFAGEGQQVTVIAKCNENTWYKVRVGEVTGYINGSYLTDVNPNPEPEVPPTTETPSTETPSTETPSTEAPGTEGESGSEGTEGDSGAEGESGSEGSEDDSGSEGESGSEETGDDSSSEETSGSASDSTPNDDGGNSEESIDPNGNVETEPSEPDVTA